MLTLRLLVVCGVVAFFTGCGQSPVPAPEHHADDGHKHGAEGHTHGEWWCGEHGMPEEICVQCNSKLAAGFKKKGDWCEKHNLPDSQCFECHPEHEAKFAAQYEAKYGKQPPKREGT